MNEENLITYYNKFNEDKRLERRHGQVEFITTMKYIKKYLKKDSKIIDIGAGTGKYSLELASLGYQVDAVELVKHNLKVIEKKSKKVNTFLGNAKDLSKFNDNTYDLTLLFGPMYHLISYKDKLKALNEAKRITKKDGIIMIVYCMNDFALIKHGFIDKHILSCIKNKEIDKKYKIISNEKDLYSFVDIKDINKLNKDSNLKRIKIISQDGLTEYMRKEINNLSQEEFNEYLKYHLKNCERKELLGYSRHLIDIVKKV